ncbi:MAG: ABC-F family ATP-binding cassette domain-containing protein [Polyangiaceae bacterium]
MIRFDSIGHQHGRKILFYEASASVNRGEKIGLVGPNGSGKTTLFRMILGEEEPDTGRVTIDRGTTIGYFSQDVGEMSGRTVVAETVAGAGEVAQVFAELRSLEEALSDPERADEMEALVERLGDAQARFEQLGGYAVEAKARSILAGLGFSDATMDGDVGALSGGWKMRVALAQILLKRADVLLLDEPTNHLDLESILWLETYLRDFDGAIVMTSHDRAFMNRVVSKILEIDAGDITTYTGDYDHYVKERAIADLHAQAAFERQQAMLAKEQRFIERFKARASHAAQVQSRVKKLEKIEKVEEPPKVRKLKFDFRAPPRSGDDVASLAHVVKSWGTKPIYDDLDMLIRIRERWCVMGQNGAGKSTLLKLVVGAATPDAGEVKIGASVKLGYFAQHAMDLLDGAKSVWECTVERFPKASEGQLKTLLGAFGFPGEDTAKPVRVLSGGEKARLVLALMMFDPPNFLVLDEPTNHLDLATKEMLIDCLKDFEGTMLFVSHDRHFLAALSNRVLEVGSGKPTVYGGGYSEYVSRTGREAPGMR